MGMLFVQMGRLEEAANSFEWVMREKAEFKAGLHAVLCHFALSHRDKMKRAFLELLEVQLNIDQEDKYSINPVSFGTIVFCLLKLCISQNVANTCTTTHHSVYQLIMHKGAHISHSNTFILIAFFYQVFNV